jgi:lipid II:glycine glycyltransferase (peptidoglycan interpeptide bridge formation enzyme)
MVCTKVEVNQKNIEYLVSLYQDLQLRKGFAGLANQLIFLLAKRNSTSKNWSFNLFQCSINGQNVGMRATVHHGSVATDLVVATTECGDHSDANTALYWSSILYAKEAGMKYFDIGGLNSETAKGVADFKRGLGAEIFEHVGEWRRYHFVS